MSVTDDINRLDELIAKLRKDYDQFFAGIVRQEPVETRRIVEQIIGHHTSRAIQNSQHAFRFRNLVARYNTFNQMWQRRLREREEGIVIGRPMARRSGAGERDQAAAAPPPPQESERQPAQAARDPLAQLYDTYVEARSRTGEATPVDPESFRRLIQSQIKKIKQTHECRSVSFKVTVEDGKAKLKAVVKS